MFNLASTWRSAEQEISSVANDRLKMAKSPRLRLSKNELSLT